MKYKCLTKCFYDNRLYGVGEILETDVKNAPKHFSLAKSIEEAFYEPDETAKTLKALQDKDEAQDKLAYIGNLTKDDLIVEVDKFGLSEGRNLVALKKIELIELLKNAITSQTEGNNPEGSDMFEGSK